MADKGIRWFTVAGNLVRIPIWVGDVRKSDAGSLAALSDC